VVTPVQPFCRSAHLTSPHLTSHFITADIISAVEFNHDGEYLATGDKGGRVVLFERNNTGVGNDAE
jgi:WD40 repeat protein